VAGSIETWAGRILPGSIANISIQIREEEPMTNQHGLTHRERYGYRSHWLKAGHTLLLGLLLLVSSALAQEPGR